MAWSGISLPMENNPLVHLPPQICPPMEFFFWKKVLLPHTLWGETPWRGLSKWNWKQKELVETQIKKINSWQDTVHFCTGVSCEQHNEFQISLSLWVQFSGPFAKIYFLSNLQSCNLLSYIGIGKYIYFLYFLPWISNINLNIKLKFLDSIFFYLISIFHFILRNYSYCDTAMHWKVLYDLMFSRVQYYVNYWLFNEKSSQ